MNSSDISTAVKKYLRKMNGLYQRNDATEQSGRTVLKNFLETIDDRCSLIHEPKQVQDLGAPDFKALRKGVKIGYIETKKPDENLYSILKTEQLERYLRSISNLVLTNYVQFLLLRNGKVVMDVALCSPIELKNKPKTNKTRLSDFSKLIEVFLSYEKEQITSARELAHELAIRARLLRDYSKHQLEIDLSSEAERATKSSVYHFYLGMKELLTDLTVSECADAYAQTITYGLFLAKYMSDPIKIRRNTAWERIPGQIAVIKTMFRNISGNRLPAEIRWIVDEIISNLNASDMKSIMSAPSSKGSVTGWNPFAFFYEDFLAEYAPEERKRLGVYFTPTPVVNFIVKAVDSILENRFDLPLGFCDDEVTLLDPATGTGTFLYEAIHQSMVKLLRRNLRGLIEKKIENHVLEHFYGFELLITPYIISHLKLTTLLGGRWNYEFGDEERLQVYLTNTLEPKEVHGLLPFLGELTEETTVANQIKGPNTEILTIVGNPPYSGHSANKGDWIDSKLKKPYERADESISPSYYEVDGEPLDEKNTKWLQDDYVKFIRYAQWKIDLTGEGIVGFITNNGYLNNPTFKGMRQSLLDSFDNIYIINLHGSSIKKETSPDGSVDENVFDIRPGVSIAIFVKHESIKDSRVSYVDVFGTRESKFEWLGDTDSYNIEWEVFKPKSPNYFFVPLDRKLYDEYTSYPKVIDIFPEGSIGVVTARDNLTIHWTADQVWETVTDFVSLNPEVAREKYDLGDDVRDWKVHKAQEDLQNSSPSRQNITEVLYRPFDVRYTYYTGNSRGFHCMPRGKIMRHLLQPNIAICVGRQWESVGSDSYDTILVSDKIVDFNLFRRGGEMVLPLYIYNFSSSGTPLDYKENINPGIRSRLESMLGCSVSAEDLFHYVYAILFNPTYRERYEEFLKSDYPRIPLSADIDIFRQLSHLGKSLAELHLMKRKLPSDISFNIPGSNKVESRSFRDNKIFINDDQFFGGIPESVWKYHIGGNRVIDKWLKSRNGKELTSDEIEQLIQIVEIIRKTTEITTETEQILNPWPFGIQNN